MTCVLLCAGDGLKRLCLCGVALPSVSRWSYWFCHHCVAAATGPLPGWSSGDAALGKTMCLSVGTGNCVRCVSFSGLLQGWSPVIEQVLLQKRSASRRNFAKSV